MKIKNIIITIILLSLLIGPTTIFAAVDTGSQDYVDGYEAGVQVGIDNFGKEVLFTDAFDEYTNNNNINWNTVNFQNFREGFKVGFEEGMSGVTIKINYADILGRSLGSIYAARDYQSGKDSDWKKVLPSDKEIISMYKLDMETDLYVDSFLDAFVVSFQEGYENKYEKVLLDPARNTQQQGVKDGEEIGGLLGATFGVRDFFSKRNKDFERDLPTKKEIVSYYSLGRDNDEYEEGFISGFLSAYEEEYNKAFRQSNYDNFMRDESGAQDSGRQVGSMLGATQAVEDYMLKRDSDWKRSLPSERYVIMEYDLIYHSENYRTHFVAGFFDGYSEGYQTKYKELTVGAAVEKSTSILIPISGGSLISADNSFSVNIPAGTYYHKINLSISTSYNVDNYSSYERIKASNDYSVKTLNTSGNVDSNKKIALAFEYYGDKQKGGIYKLTNGEWNYIPSAVEGNAIVAYISPSMLGGNGTTFSVFVEKQNTVFRDARSHWANDEINAFVRRGILSGYPDGTFKPEQNITRAEFLIILSRLYDWNTNYYYGANYGFKDQWNFGMYNNIINYSSSNGFINGYPDNTFRPKNPISYREVELIVGRVIGDYNFRWSDIATQILYERKAKSNSFLNYNNSINRAEVVYMLYNLAE